MTSLIDAKVFVTLPLVVFVLALLPAREALLVVPVFVGSVFVLPLRIAMLDATGGIVFQLEWTGGTLHGCI